MRTSKSSERSLRVPTAPQSAPKSSAIRYDCRTWSPTEIPPAYNPRSKKSLAHLREQRARSGGFGASWRRTSNCCSVSRSCHCAGVCFTGKLGLPLTEAMARVGAIERQSTRTTVMIPPVNSSRLLRGCMVILPAVARAFGSATADRSRLYCAGVRHHTLPFSRSVST